MAGKPRAEHCGEQPITRDRRSFLLGPSYARGMGWRRKCEWAAACHVEPVRTRQPRVPPRLFSRFLLDLGIEEIRELGPCRTSSTASSELDRIFELLSMQERDSSRALDRQFGQRSSKNQCNGTLVLVRENNILDPPALLTEAPGQSRGTEPFPPLHR